ncbi:unnamed protein product [Moneuplotes crassus]|uniref:Uncharacterized protein n=1 Tax=Euplotes crassus TaxID=5936 RepID=A0AAD1UJJ2_EUPCR|nr:unnamed protein product [Moneuplotes crassus]
MPGMIDLAKSDIEDQQAKLLLYRIAEHAVQETAFKFLPEENKISRTVVNKKKVLNKKEARSFLCSFVQKQLHKAGYHNSMVIVGKDFNISLKYKKNTLMRFILPCDYIMMFYESPNITLPSLRHSHTAHNEEDDKYEIKVKACTPISVKNEENKGKVDDPNYTDISILDVKECQIEEVIAKNLSHCLNEFTELKNNGSTAQLDLCELPQMISGQVTKILAEMDDSKTREYGWHFIVSDPFNPGAEVFHINTSVEHYYNQSIEDQKAGIFNVIYREYTVDFLLPPKMAKQQFHIVVYRVNRGHDSAIGSALKSVTSIKLLDLLSVSSIHKVFFVLLVIVYFGNRFICGKYDDIDYSNVPEDHQIGTIENLCKNKNNTILMVAISFIILSVLKQIFGKLQDRNKAIAKMRMKQKRD